MAKKPSRPSRESKQPIRYSSYRPGGYRPGGEDSPNDMEAKPSRSIPRRLGRAAAGLLILLIIFGLIIGAWDARNISAASRKLFGTGDIFSLLNSGDLQTDAGGRVNIVVAGYSADDPGHSGADLTDSIMLLSLNPANHTGYMLSVPRDLYVQIPGYGHGKINEAYNDGGMPLLSGIVQNITGSAVGYYALINYSAVRGIVDALGGIDVTINSPEGRLYDPNIDYATHGPLVDLTNGTHHLNGQQALNLTRARGDFLPTTPATPIGFGQSDFQRTADQRLVFSAIKSRLSWKLILDPRQNGKIMNAVAGNVKTDIGAAQARPLFGLFNSVPTSKLQSLSLRDLNGKNYLVSSYYEGDTLTPAAGLDDYSQIDDAISQLN